MAIPDPLIYEDPTGYHTLNTATAMYKDSGSETNVRTVSATALFTWLFSCLALSWLATNVNIIRAKSCATQLIVAVSVAISGGTPSVKTLNKKGYAGPRSVFSLEQKLEPGKLVHQSTRQTVSLKNSLMPAIISETPAKSMNRARHPGLKPPRAHNSHSTDSMMGLSLDQLEQEAASALAPTGSAWDRQVEGETGWSDERAPAPCAGPDGWYDPMDGVDVGHVPRKQLLLPRAQVHWVPPPMQGRSIFTSELFELPHK